MPRHTRSAAPKAPRMAPTAMKTVPSGSVDRFMKGASWVGGTVGGGYVGMAVFAVFDKVGKLSLATVGMAALAVTGFVFDASWPAAARSALSLFPTASFPCTKPTRRSEATTKMTSDSLDGDDDDRDDLDAPILYSTRRKGLPAKSCYVGIAASLPCWGDRCKQARDFPVSSLGPLCMVRFSERVTLAGMQP